MKVRDSLLVKVYEEDIVDGKFVVPDFVTDIGKNCFSECISSLEEVVMHDNVVSIGEHAFYSCVALKKIVFSKNLKAIYPYAFSNCHSLKNLILPDSLEYLAEGTFSSCTFLESVKLSKNLSTLENYLFDYCIRLKHISIPNSVFKIGSNSFASCISLEELDLPNSVRIIDKYAFFQCTALKSIYLKDGLFKIGDNAFYCCLELEECKLPSTLITIGNSAFDSCSKMKEFVLPKNIETIGKGSFANCVYLNKIDIPQGLNIIESSLFKGCIGLYETNIPKSVKTIKDNAYNDTYLLELHLPNSITYVGNSAFANNRLLTNIELSTNLDFLGENAFDNCPSVEQLKIYDNIKSLAFNAIGVNNEINYIVKKENYFLLTKTLKDKNLDYIELDDKIREIKELLIKFWDRKEQILQNIKKDSTFYVYKTLYSLLWQDCERFEEFLNSNNTTFYNLLDFKDVDERNKKMFLKFYYNLGGFLPKSKFKKNNKFGIIKEKMIDYSQIVTEFLKEKICKNKFDFNLSSRIFSSMEARGFNQEFTIFFLENFDNLMQEAGNNPDFIAKCYNYFEEVQATHTTNKGDQRQLKATFKKFKDYFNVNKFVRVTNEHQRLIAKMLSKYHSSQSVFDNAVSIDQERKKNHVANSILSFHLQDLNFDEVDSNAKISMADNEECRDDMIKYVSNETFQKAIEKGEIRFGYDWLNRDDPTNFIISKIIQKGCAHLEGMGYGIMRASIVDENVQNMAIKARVFYPDGENVDLGYIGKATLYLNRKEKYGVFNTIKIRDLNLSHSTQEKLYLTFLKGTYDFIYFYNKEHPDAMIDEITIGKSSNDLIDVFQRHCKQITGDNVLAPLDYSKYGNENLNYFGDSLVEQFVVFKTE